MILLVKPLSEVEIIPFEPGDLFRWCFCLNCRWPIPTKQLFSRECCCGYRNMQYGSSLYAAQLNHKSLVRRVTAESDLEGYEVIPLNWFKRKGPPITPKAQEIIDLILKLENTPDGSGRKNIAIQLNQLCLRNPKTVAALILDDDSGLNEPCRKRLLFHYSTDHWGSCKLPDNPLWVTMMRQFIVPLIDQLPSPWRQQLEWYQEVYGL